MRLSKFIYGIYFLPEMKVSSHPKITYFKIQGCLVG